MLVAMSNTLNNFDFFLSRGILESRWADKSLSYIFIFGGSVLYLMIAISPKVSMSNGVLNLQCIAFLCILYI